jgi:hypothetical protein
MSSPPLAVPIQLDALVVNAGVLGQGGFRWWQYDYASLEEFASPEPLAFDDSDGSPAPGTPPMSVVCLSWELPQTLRHSGPDSGNAFPVVPNRWLLVRANGTSPRQLTAWVIESDCPNPGGGSSDLLQASPYLVDADQIQTWQASSDPYRNQAPLSATSTDVQVAELGLSFALDGWTERAPTPMFLTAVAPANPMFSTYIAHNLGVFSFVDTTLDQVDTDTLSYFVYGWFSDPSQDPLASVTDSASLLAVLADLQWASDEPAPPPSTTSVYHGAACDIGWDPAGDPPAGDPLVDVRTGNRLAVGIGNTAIDAFTALVAPALGDPAQAEVLQAFQYDLLGALNSPDGQAELAAKVRQAWYASTAGGSTWTIVDEASDSGGPAVLTAAEQAWLQTLNTDQAALDAALVELAALQWEVHGLWLRQQFLAVTDNTWPNPPDGVGDLPTFQQRLDDALDPTNSTGPAARLIALYATVSSLSAAVPQPDPRNPDPEQALQDAITAFAQAKAISAGKLLKAKAAPRYWQAANPVLVLSGVQPPPPAVPTADLPVRTSDEWVTAAGAAAQAVADLVGSLDLSAIPGAPAALLTECLLLDPSDPVVSTPVAPAVLPSYGAGAWHQPWSPLVCEWKLTYQQVGNDGTLDGWAFDGTDYEVATNPAPTPAKPHSVGGISLLTGQLGFVFGSRLDSFVQTYGGDDQLGQLDAWLAQTYGWNFLAQELTGFHELLALRDYRAFRRPGPTDEIDGLPVAALTGFGDADAPASLTLQPGSQGSVDTVPYFPDGPAETFHGVRQGVAYLTDLLLYDKFGRELWVLEGTSGSGLYDYRNYPVQLDPNLQAPAGIVPGIASVLRLPPRPLQPARLDARLLDAVSDDLVWEVDPGVVPIAGWVLPNHLDNSLSLYAPDGSALGEFGLFAAGDGTLVGAWTPPPGGALTPADVARSAPHLAAMIAAPPLADQGGFAAFLAAIDETLWTTDPLAARVDANLSVLIGRPLALVRTRLELQLAGSPISDTGWAATFDDSTPDYVGTPVPVRLGAQHDRTDGVIGYFAGADYSVFTAVAKPADTTQSYVRASGPASYLSVGLGDGSYAYATVLVDPRAAIHLSTGVVPVKQLDLPQQVVGAALAALQVSFRAGPLLTAVVPTPAPNPTQGTAPPYPNSILIPTPAEQVGTWSWWEPGSPSSTGYGIVAASATAGPPQAPAQLREGSLQFGTDLDSSTI